MVRFELRFGSIERNVQRRPNLYAKSKPGLGGDASHPVFSKLQHGGKAASDGSRTHLYRYLELLLPYPGLGAGLVHSIKCPG
jgi:hypothetical protein